MELPRKYDIRINHKKVARIKREYGLITRIRRKNRHKLFRGMGHEHKVQKNILKRNFKPTTPDTIYSTDITLLYFSSGRKAYLSAVKDLCTHEIVAHTVSSQAHLNLSLTVAHEAINKVPPNKRRKLIIHSDQGSHYTSRIYQNILKSSEVTQSMSRRGNCLDNAPIESFFGHFKDEIDLEGCQSIEEVKNRVAKYMDYYNNQRPQWSLKEKSPAEHRGFLLNPGFS